MKVGLMHRPSVRIGLVLVLLAGSAWFYRAELGIGAIGIFVELMRDIGPHREVAWQRGPATAMQPPSERPPNIVLSLAGIPLHRVLERRHTCDAINVFPEGALAAVSLA